MRAAVSAAQSVLRDSGRDIKIDGIWGPLTDGAYVKSSDTVKRDVSVAVERYGTTVDALRQPKRYAPNQNYAFVRDGARAAGLNGTELANFLATVQAESGMNPRAIESGAYRNVEQVRSGMRGNRVIDAMSYAALSQLFGSGPAALFNAAYGGRNGNVAPGDGWKYRGRGLMMLTWRGNYIAAGKALGLPLEDDPDLIIRDPEVSLKVALWYWKTRVRSAGSRSMSEVTVAVRGSVGDDLARRQGILERFLRLDSSLTTA